MCISDKTEICPFVHNMNHDSGFIIEIAHVFFAKLLIERTPKNHLEKHPSTQNNPLLQYCVAISCKLCMHNYSVSPVTVPLLHH